MVLEMVKKTQFVKDLKEKETVSSAFLIKFSALSTDKNGKPYMNLVLMDNSGEVESRIWDDANIYAAQAVRDSFVWVEGRCQSYQNRKQIVIHKLQMLREDQIEPKHYVPEGTVDPEPLYAKLLAYIERIEDPHYRALAEIILKDDADVVEKLKRAPAAKSYHHAYKAGLLDHMVSVMGLIDSVGAHYAARLDMNLLLIGGLLHDIGKLWELSYERVTDYTTEGKLIGHLVMGTELIERKVNELNAKGLAIGPFPEERKIVLKHLILAHHGELEFGSPKRPKCLEALVLHYVDDLDSKVNAIGTFLDQDQTPGRWSAYNRMYDRFFLKPDRTGGSR
jgi:3'-5' exoribonuclease